MKGITIGLLVAAGVVGLWATQRAVASRRAEPQHLAQAQRPLMAEGSAKTAPTSPAGTPKDPIDPKMVVVPKGNIDPKMVIVPKGDIDPKMIRNPPPPHSPEDRPSQPRPL